ncbi:MAG: hypothetical protein HOK63_00865 [Thaumarchaeota archaeon]|nr:hypothetical protein [Nitrososphaerota archaeon]MBT5842661.1 hypothetical protein [Nitrososphaerota archaeon]MBT6468191.1 hypothetical protein [Nitrososphaerota archaeon]
MRLGSRSPNEFIQLLNKQNESIQKSFVSKISERVKMIDVKVMMGDSTITDQKTFDPKLVSDYFQKISSNLKDWQLQDVSISNNEDLRRIFTKFEIMEENYIISGHISIQFHVLLYYKPEQRVIDCQKELSDIVDLTKSKEQEISDNSDQLVLNKLKEKGYKDFDHQKLFEIFYEKDELREEIMSEIEDESGTDFKELSDKKKKLFDELDSLLIETYQIVPVLIDDARLVSGEEGTLLTLDIEFSKNNNREGQFDPRKMSDVVKNNISKKLKELENIIQQ